MKIRQAKLEDVKSISKIISKLDFKDFKPSDNDLVKSQILRKEYFVAEENENIIGALCLSIEEKSAEIYSIVSLRKGIGKELILYAEKICVKKGISKIWAWSLKKYEAQQFYDKMGFTEQFLLKKQWFNEDCYFFGKVLS